MVVGIWVGRATSIVGLAAWCGWLGWRMTSVPDSPIGGAVLVLELMAYAAALLVTSGLWLSPGPSNEFARSSGRPTPMPVMMADALGLDRSLVTLADRDDVGEDDTGEIAWARRGLGVLGRGATRRPGAGTSLVIREGAWSVVSVDGLRRMMAVVVLLAVLFTGRAPFDRPPATAIGLLTGGVAGVALGHWLLSRGRIRPGSRLIWSMASVGAGLGDGRSRSGLPIRWVTTMATMVVLNLAVALRGLSDRWTHGLGPMPHEARVASMSLAIGFVVVGLFGLRTLPRPDLGFYGATHRLEEASARRLALGGTIAVALLGFVVGVLPTDGGS